MLHCHDGKADCSDVLYIFSVRMSVYHARDIPFKLHYRLSSFDLWSIRTCPESNGQNHTNTVTHPSNTSWENQLWAKTLPRPCQDKQFDVCDQILTFEEGL